LEIVPELRKFCGEPNILPQAIAYFCTILEYTTSTQNKRLRDNSRNPLYLLVGRLGIEPRTYWLRDGRFNY